MNEQVVPDLDFSPRTKRTVASKPEPVEAAYLLEQFTSPISPRTERPVAEILAKHLVETDPASPSPAFIL